jgi:hypothetical protein
MDVPEMEKEKEIIAATQTFIDSSPPLDVEWRMPAHGDPEFLEKLEQMPLWANKFRKEDFRTISETLSELGFNVTKTAGEVHRLYEMAGRPKIVGDKLGNEQAGRWSFLFNDILHIVTTRLYLKHPEDVGKPQVIDTVLSSEERNWPLHRKHGHQNNIAVYILSSDEKELVDFKEEARRVTDLWNKEDKSKEEMQECLKQKLALELKYFQKLHPDFF